MKAFMKLLLLGNYPIRSKFSDRLEFRTDNYSEHPSTWILNLIELLRSTTIELSMVSLNSQLCKDYDFVYENCHFYFLKGTPYRLQPITMFQFDKRRILNTINLIKPQLIQSFGTENAYSYAGVSTSVPCIIYMQGIISELIKLINPHDNFYKWMHYYIARLLERTTVKQGQYFIAENYFSRDFVRGLNKNASIFVLPNLINPCFFDVEPQTYPNNKLIIFVGSAKTEKGIYDLLNAFMIVKNTIPECKLEIIGNISSKDHTKITSLIEETNNNNQIKLVGIKDANYLKQVMKKAAILVHPSWMDTSPNSILEAMVAGLPVIASDVGGIPNIIMDNETGLLIKPRDTKMIAEKIIYLLNNPSERNRLSTNAKNVMRRKLDHSDLLDSLLRIYQLTLSTDKQ